MFGRRGPCADPGRAGTASTLSGEDLADRPAVVDIQPLAPGDVEPSRVEPEQVQRRGVDVGDIVGVFNGVETQLVGGAVDGPALDPGPREPDGEGVGVVVAAGGDG